MYLLKDVESAGPLDLVRGNGMFIALYVKRKRRPKNYVRVDKTDRRLGVV